METHIVTGPPGSNYRCPFPIWVRGFRSQYADKKKKNYFGYFWNSRQLRSMFSREYHLVVILGLSPLFLQYSKSQDKTSLIHRHTVGVD